MLRRQGMQRRDFLRAFTAGAAALSAVAYAQKAELIRRVGVLMQSPENSPTEQEFVTAFAQALRRLGWVEGGNIRFDYRFAAGDPALFKSYAADLVGMAPDAILASTTPAVAALREQTRTIPVVFVLVGNPDGQGFVQSLARPGGNMTGFSSLDAPLMGKWLQLLKEIAPGVTRVAVIFSADTAIAAWLNRAIEAAAPSVGMTPTFAPVHDAAGIEDAVAADRNACRVADFGKSSIVIVAEKKIGLMVVGDKNVLPAVVVVVEGDHAQPIPAF